MQWIRVLGILAALCSLCGAGAFAAVCACARRRGRESRDGCAARGANLGVEAKNAGPSRRLVGSPEGTPDCLIVLGARVWPDGRMSETLRLRCERALALWRETGAPGIVACGGRGGDEPCAEAEVMRAFFMENSVPALQIVVDADSASTRANLVNARRIMAERGWTTAAVVTSDYHLTRALWIAADLGMQAVGAAAASPNRRGARLRAYGRETVSWALYALRRLRSD